METKIIKIDQDNLDHKLMQAQSLPPVPSIRRCR